MCGIDLRFMDLDVCVGCEMVGNVSKRVEDVMPIATGHEREELEAELQVSFCATI